jgi:hypothetical protein
MTRPWAAFSREAQPSAMFSWHPLCEALGCASQLNRG